jgi:hypothetical protein
MPEPDGAAKKKVKKKPFQAVPKKLTEEECAQIRAAWGQAESVAYDDFRDPSGQSPGHHSKRGAARLTAAAIEKAGRDYNRWLFERLGETQDEFRRWQLARTSASYPIALAWASEKNWGKAFAAL